MSPSEFLQEITRAQARGESLGLVSVVRVRGSAPRGPGARMLVFADGSTKGSVSGGCLEAEAYARARRCMREGGTDRFEYDLTKDVQEGEGMVCGGKVEVFVEVLGPKT